MFMVAHHRILSQARWIQYTLWQPIPVRCVLMFSCHLRYLKWRVHFPVFTEGIGYLRCLLLWDVAQRWLAVNGVSGNLSAHLQELKQVLTA